MGHCYKNSLEVEVGKIPWRRAWQPTPVSLPGESSGQRNLEGYSPWGCRGRHDFVTQQHQRLINACILNHFCTERLGEWITYHAVSLLRWYACCHSSSRVWLFVTPWPWDFPGKTLERVAMPLSRGIFPAQGSKLCLFCLLPQQAGSLPLVPPGKTSTGDEVNKTDEDKTPSCPLWVPKFEAILYQLSSVGCCQSKN